jgi:hypothetical protein
MSGQNRYNKVLFNHKKEQKMCHLQENGWNWRDLVKWNKADSDRCHTFFSQMWHLDFKNT